MRMRTPITVIAAAAIAIGLSGCFGNPVESIIESTVEEAVEGATGVEVDVDTDGSGASVPADFPSELPMPDGKLISSLAADGTFILDFEVSDDTAGAAFAQQFKDMGWTEEAASDMGEFKTWVYFDSASSLVVSISQLGGEGVAPRLTYSVSPRT